MLIGIVLHCPVDGIRQAFFICIWAYVKGEILVDFFSCLIDKVNDGFPCRRRFALGRQLPVYLQNGFNASALQRFFHHAIVRARVPDENPRNQCDDERCCGDDAYFF